MKDFLLIGIVLFVIVSLFADGGLTVSPKLSPQLSAALDVNYESDHSVETTTIETQVLGDYVEQQTVVVQPVQAAKQTQPSSGTIAEGRPGAQCMTVPGDVILTQGGNGECRVVNNGQKFFISPAGTRAWLGAADSVEATPIQPQPQATIDGRWLAIVPPDQMSLEQLKSNFKRNGGRLPMGFVFWTYDEQRAWLTDKPEAWR